ncbi:MAG: hypothetical protein LC798_05400 [Chloroflexi bacterium]|nr:hypothetical protein [Chloroflexota bacterium]
MPIVEWNGPKILRDVERAARRGMEDAGRQIANDARQKLSKPYPPASRPGQPPHRRTGALAAAQEHKVTEEGGDIVLKVDTRPGLKYAPIMASRRPWLAVSTAEALVFDEVTDEVRSALR